MPDFQEQSLLFRRTLILLLQSEVINNEFDKMLYFGAPSNFSQLIPDSGEKGTMSASVTALHLRLDRKILFVLERINENILILMKKL